MEETARENHPPLYFLLLSLWTKLGPPGEGWARFLSVVLGTLLVGAVYRLSQKLGMKETGLLACLFLAFSPWAVWHSQDARMYPLALLCAVVSLTLFLEYIEEGGSAGKPILGALALTASLYSHLYAISAFPVLGLYLLRRRKEIPRRRWWTAALAVFGVCVVWLPWVMVVLSIHHHAGFYKPLSLFTVPYTLFVFSVGYSLGPSLQELRAYVSHPALPHQYWVVVLAAAVLFGGLLAAGAWRCRAALRRRGEFLLLLFWIPLAVPVCVTLLNGEIDFNARYAFLSFPALLLLLSLGVSRCRSRFLRWGAACAVLAFMTASLVSHFTDQRYAKEDARQAHRLVESMRSAEDCILVIGVTPAYQYYEGGAVRSRWLDFRYPDRVPESAEEIRRWSATCPRLWFVAGRTWEEDPQGMARPTLEKFFVSREEWDVHGVHILEMEPRKRRSS
ncbi:MAG TPA: glycosyltransferase family 39 protein [Candidatus Polarisedimenticolia bacterium]|nr:glycosyltransferase family 39 protein [Candidatus Polarisedimenticolia bacterium]